MAPTPAVTLHTTQTYLPQYFEPVPALLQLLSARPEQFMLVRTEAVYPHLRGPVPAVRSTGHTALFVTSGEARMAVGYDHYAARTDELLLVPAGQVHSFGPDDVSTGYLCHFHPDLLRRAGVAEPEFLTSWGQPHLRFGPDAAAFVRALLARMLALYEARQLAALPLLLPQLAACWPRPTTPISPRPAPRPRRRPRSARHLSAC